MGIRLVGNDEPIDPRWKRDDYGNLRDENGLIVCIPIDEYDPDDLGEAAYRAIARVLDENRAARARREAGGAA